MEKNYTEFVIKYKPFSWEIFRNTPQLDIKGKSSVVVNHARYSKVVEYVRDAAANRINLAIIDFGAYPGSWVKIAREFFKFTGPYYSVGLGLDDEFKGAMESFGAQTIEYELDPDFKYGVITQDLDLSGGDICLFLDTIEHLTSPINSLDQINKVMKKGGKLIITTDNISSFGHTMHMLKAGDSPNIHPLRSNVFYNGPWRPHFREYSKDELAFFLQYSGFSIVKHEYFERMQGDFYIDEVDSKLKKNNRYKSISGLIKRFCCVFFPHLRDHQILLAEKVEEYESVMKDRVGVTDSMEVWLNYRARFGL